MSMMKPAFGRSLAITVWIPTYDLFVMVAYILAVWHPFCD